MIGHQGEPKTGSFYIQYSTHSTFSAGDESERKRKEKEVEATATTLNFITKVDQGFSQSIVSSSSFPRQFVRRVAHLRPFALLCL